MNALEQTHEAHTGSDASLRTGHDADCQLLSDVTARLSAAMAAPDDFRGLVEVMHDNRLLWKRLAAAVADENSGVPSSLQAQISDLAEFTQRHTARVLRDLAGPEVLVDINNAVLRGLAGLLLTAAPARPMVYQ